MIPDPIDALRAVVIDPRVRDKALADDFDWRDYAKSRDPQLVKAKEGGHPAWFVLDALDVLFVAEVVDSQKAESAKRLLAFLASCRSVECGSDIVKPAAFIQGLYGSRIAEDDFARVVAKKYSMHAIYEMGDVAIQRAKLPDGARGPFVWSAI